ncbi:MAG: imidazole glycerol phosphate synthase subunit HisH [Bdellovibrionales bacterium]|nr:imidazole glycerol phosphate synthase subunit HisH [Bdellovibrionales bacterium]
MIAVVDSGGANIRSIVTALEGLGEEAKLTCDPEILRRADRLVLPGVGSALKCREKLDQSGMIPLLCELKVPILGICIGMQILFESLDEGPCSGLGFISGTVDRFIPQKGFPVPHMGWNQIRVLRGDSLLEGLDEAWFYYTHSYKAPMAEGYTLASSQYSCEFSAVVKKENWYGVQFHPEKSAEAGQRLLKNFLEVKK